MASGALAMVIPPSALAVLLGSIAGISVGKILIGAIIPGILLMVFYYPVHDGCLYFEARVCSIIRFLKRVH